MQADTPPWLQRYNPGQAFLLIEQKQLLLNQSLSPDALITPIFRLQHLSSMDELRQCLHTIAMRTHPLEHVVLPLHLPHGNTPLIHSFEDIDAMINYEERNWELRWMKQGLAKGMEQGIEQGLEQGREQGIEQGRRAGEQGILQQQLQHRFGPLDLDTQHRLEQADGADLLHWSLKLLAAKTLPEVFDS